ncbi:MAG: Holliday junction branch migration protein RuvA [Proteobacteria bacterium]|nr:Holliday junction branch migration protein RuvA [Pseudomonadota bacterium]MCL2308211.1 Holliday junction branch migration protein RuvA [Pseudomonadota bacterium]
MIGRLSGTLLEKNPPQILLDVQGVGYELLVPMSTFYHLPDTGATVSLLTHLIVREDAHTLYGFAAERERQAFRVLTKISGIGARTALAVLSGLSTEELAQAVAAQEVGRLTRVPGIGKKTAERILLELKGKLAPALGGGNVAVNAPSGVLDVINALLALGYNEKEAHAATRDLPADIDVSDGIRKALKQLSKT